MMAAKTVAVVGASGDRTKFGNKSLRAHMAQGWEAYPVNPKGGTIEGLTVYRSLEEIPVRIDRVTMYVPPPVGMAMLPAIAALKPDEVWFNPGSESDELVEEARALGLNPIVACSIVGLGVSPAAF